MRIRGVYRSGENLFAVFDPGALVAIFLTVAALGICAGAVSSVDGPEVARLGDPMEGTP